MMAKGVRPDLTEATFKYDSLGRRIEKRSEDKATHFVWEGNTICMSIPPRMFDIH